MIKVSITKINAEDFKVVGNPGVSQSLSPQFSLDLAVSQSLTKKMLIIGLFVFLKSYLKNKLQTIKITTQKQGLANNSCAIAVVSISPKLT